MSFNIALSGLDATNTELNTISHNIANSATTGYRGARTEFSAVYNGFQPGGVEVSGITQNFDKTGSITGTGRSLDVAINGKGFFITKGSSGEVLYSRSGALNKDKDNFIVNDTGAKMQGYNVDGDNNLQTGAVTDLKLNTASLNARATDRLGFVANFDASAEAVNQVANPFNPNDPNSFNSSYTSQVYDSLGNTHTVTQYFTKTAPNTWEVNVQVDGSTTPVATQDVEFNEDGTLASPQGSYDISFPAAGAEEMNIAVSIDGSTQFGAEFGVSTNNPNGYTAGDLAGIRIEGNGMLYATYTNGESQLQGQVVLANFANPQGLGKVSGTAWTQSYSSGAPIVGAPSTGTLGDLTPGALESSNVDLTSELVSLMTTQRNYQANAKSISTEDKLTQALFNAI